jgi:pimeloyl-ACP methyl ester carboxylesterase
MSHFRLLAVCVIAIAVVPGRSARADHAPGGTIEGLFGIGAGAVWIMRPVGAPRSIVVFGHGWKFSPPSGSNAWVNQFRPWLDHLLAGGSAILFPRYQIGGDAPGPARVSSLRRGLIEGFARLGLPGLPVVVAGYSYGASLAFYYAANARRWHLPIPKAVFSVFPAGLIDGAPLPGLPKTTKVVIQVGDRDTVAGRPGAQPFWVWLAAHPYRRKRLEIIRSGPSLDATHAAPKLSTAGAQTAFWTPLDALVDRSR